VIMNDILIFLKILEWFLPKQKTASGETDMRKVYWGT